MRRFYHHLAVFVATRRTDVPAGCERFISVDGTVPGYALRWDHHVTGESINLDALPAVIDASGYDGIGTTLADADALASVVAVLFGGTAGIPSQPRALLESASYWCDHLRGHPGHTHEVNQQGRGLLDAIAARLQAMPRSHRSGVFAALAFELAECIASGQPLPFLDAQALHQQRAEHVVRGGQLQCCGAVALVDLRQAPEIEPAALYARHRCPIAVHMQTHRDGGLRYTVGAHPDLESAPDDIRPALAALAVAEFRHGPPAISGRFEPGQENWGGRARVCGSPWNYGSRLTPDQVVEIVARALDLSLEDSR